MQQARLAVKIATLLVQMVRRVFFWLLMHNGNTFQKFPTYVEQTTAQSGTKRYHAWAPARGFSHLNWVGNMNDTMAQQVCVYGCFVFKNTYICVPRFFVVGSL